MPTFRHGIARWPGAISVIGAQYTASHGISPGIAVVRMLPQPKLPAGFGDLIITDGFGTRYLPDCKVEDVKSETGENGTEIQLYISDRRWRWREAGAVAGEYNQLDPNGKLIGWTIRSPSELAAICFSILGESRFTLDLPPGLSRAIGLGINAFVGVGVNFPSTGTNPPTVWSNEPGGSALQSLCDKYGRRIVYNITHDRFDVVKLGIGKLLPDYPSIVSSSSGMNIPDSPSAVATIGDATKYQGRFELEPVGKEWDGSYKPINALSYAPRSKPQVQSNKLTVELGTQRPCPANSLYIKVTVKDEKNEEAFVISGQYGVQPADTNNLAAAGVAATIVTVPSKKWFTVVVLNNTITISATALAKELKIESDIIKPPEPNPDAFFKNVLLQAFKPGGPDWSYSMPPLFPGIVETNRLSLEQARQLAQDSVWRVFRLTGLDVSGKGSIFVPGFGRVLRRQQVYLLDTKVDQIVPEANDKLFLDKLGRPLIVNYYNGFSKDKPATAHGAIALGIYNALLKGDKVAGANTPFMSQIHVQFSVDPILQQITFSTPIYRMKPGGRIADPFVVLETGCHVRHPENNAFVRYISSKPMGGAGPVRAEVHEDVQLSVSAEYDEADGRTIKKIGILEADPIFRAKYYLEGMSLQFALAPSESRTYFGIYAIDNDGAIQQITWSVGEGGATTQASSNMEHHPYISPYPARRRAELLPVIDRETGVRGAWEEPRRPNKK